MLRVNCKAPSVSRKSVTLKPGGVPGCNNVIGTTGMEHEAFRGKQLRNCGATDNS